MVLVERNIEIEFLHKKPSHVEIVERKGVGHPDSLCDGIAEAISVALSQEYLKQVGHVLHHNVDKMLIAAGEADVHFGGGRITKPIYFCLAGRAVSQYGKHAFDVHELAIETCRNYLGKHTRFLDLEKDVFIDCRIGRGSVDLVEGFERGKKHASNDTSFGVGFAPQSTLEKTVLEIERALNSHETKKKIPESGEDIKVMGLREGNKIKVTVACAFVSKFLSEIEEYKEAKARVLEKALEVARKYEGNHEIEVSVNTLDDYEKPSVYITATGLSCENGDDGSVGRGNRVNGLITPGRPMSLEAAAGKNPVTHVGKIYNLAAFQIAEEIVREFPEVKDAEVYLLAEIGNPIDEPKIASVKIETQDGEISEVRKKIRELVDSRLENIYGITSLLVQGKLRVF